MTLVANSCYARKFHGTDLRAPQFCFCLCSPTSDSELGVGGAGGWGCERVVRMGSDCSQKLDFSWWAANSWLQSLATTYPTSPLPTHSLGTPCILKPSNLKMVWYENRKGRLLYVYSTWLVKVISGEYIWLPRWREKILSSVDDYISAHRRQTVLNLNAQSSFICYDRLFDQQN